MNGGACPPGIKMITGVSTSVSGFIKMLLFTMARLWIFIECRYQNVGLYNVGDIREFGISKELRCPNIYDIKSGLMDFMVSVFMNTDLFILGAEYSLLIPIKSMNAGNYNWFEDKMLWIKPLYFPGRCRRGWYTRCDLRVFLYLMKFYLILLMCAAHDTTTSSAIMSIYYWRPVPSNNSALIFNVRRALV